MRQNTNISVSVFFAILLKKKTNLCYVFCVFCFFLAPQNDCLSLSQYITQILGISDIFYKPRILKNHDFRFLAFGLGTYFAFKLILACCVLFFQMCDFEHALVNYEKGLRVSVEPLLSRFLIGKTRASESVL